MESNPPILIQNVSVQYGQKLVLNNITHSFPKHCVTALLGKSGGGKSTLLQLINGMVKPSAGIVRLFGQPFDYQHAARLRLKIGYAVQQIGLFPHLNVFENISLLGKVTQMPLTQIQQRVQELLAIVQLPAAYIHKFPYQLSGGEAQRVGLCRAIFLKPDILLMDEPFAALDFNTKSVIYDYFLKLQQVEPCTVVLVTHDKNEASYLADEQLWLENGTIQNKLV